MESFFAKSSHTSSVGSNTEKSCTSENVNGKEHKSRPSVKEFDTHVVEDAPEEETHPNIGSTATQANVAVSDRYDIGRAVVTFPADNIRDRRASFNTPFYNSRIFSTT